MYTGLLSARPGQETRNRDFPHMAGRWTAGLVSRRSGGAGFACYVGLLMWMARRTRSSTSRASSPATRDAAPRGASRRPLSRCPMLMPDGSSVHTGNTRCETPGTEPGRGACVTVAYPAVKPAVEIHPCRQRGVSRAPLTGVEVDEPELAILVEHEVERRQPGPFQVLAYGFRRLQQGGNAVPRRTAARMHGQSAAAT